MKRNVRSQLKWILPGIIGAILMGTGDWLLGYVDPAPVAGAPWDWLKMGYTGGFALWRPMLTMALGSLAVLFYLPAMWGMGKIFRDRKCQTKNGWLMIAGLFGWLVVHYFFSVASCVYAWACAHGDIAFAGELTAALRDVMVPGVMPWYVVMFVPFIVHFVDIMRGKSCYSRKIGLVHPLVWYFVICVVSAALPASAFANGLYTFSINGSMLIWFVAMSVIRPPQTEEAGACTGADSF